MKRGPPDRNGKRNIHGTSPEYSLRARLEFLWLRASRPPDMTHDRKKNARGRIQDGSSRRPSRTLRLGTNPRETYVRIILKGCRPYACARARTRHQHKRYSFVRSRFLRRFFFFVEKSTKRFSYTYPMVCFIKSHFVFLRSSLVSLLKILEIRINQPTYLSVNVYLLQKKCQ